MDISVPLHGKVALVTGSTSGIGLAIAKTLAANGADIALNGFATADQVATILQDMRTETGRKVEHFPHNLADFAEASALVSAVSSQFGKIDILVNNAGVQFVCDLDHFPDDEWHRLIAINLSAAFATTKAVWPQMKSRGWGRVINTASTLSFQGEPGKSAYVAAKHGVLGLTREAAIEGAQSGITCNAICPGWVMTPLAEKQVKAKAEALQVSFEEAARQVVRADMPTGRFVAPNEVAAAVLFFCSDAAKSVTGTALPIDGGLLVLGAYQVEAAK
ncbi:3-hydroxybutyrate dehydrogenase [Paraburkholderia sp. UYCP14C]|uniref:3-hydroxybutyrate dehydrogenase n=1 Tax=Paraburkholderia sp. UYCP14C TaxID=2511130 RepID=UPI00101F6A98|nr:3-hydroxybutyrate dehydrogenase [Paraburkholderia sp. UYCP14C]RZF24217.1 3-hydroxybutyrate dehydrogenase [Paraburkholderia sp. UYCP14C]